MVDSNSVEEMSIADGAEISIHCQDLFHKLTVIKFTPELLLSIESLGPRTI